MTDYVRVKQAVTGHELTLPAEHVQAAPADAYTVIDKDAVDASGDPIPAKYKVTVAPSAATTPPVVPRRCTPGTGPLG